MEPVKYFNTWNGNVKGQFWDTAAPKDTERHLVEFQKSPRMHSTHISVSMNVVLDTSVCIFKFWSPYSFVSNIIHPHRNSQHRKQGSFLHPLILQFLQPFSVKSVVCRDPSRLSHGLLWRSRGPAVQSTLGLAALFAQLCTAAACPLAASSSAGFADCVYRGKNRPKEWLFWLESYWKEHIYSFTLSHETGNMHLRKVASLYNGCRLISIY